MFDKIKKKLGKGSSSSAQTSGGGGPPPHLSPAQGLGPPARPAPSAAPLRPTTSHSSTPHKRPTPMKSYGNLPQTRPPLPRPTTAGGMSSVKPDSKKPSPMPPLVRTAYRVDRPNEKTKAPHEYVTLAHCDIVLSNGPYPTRQNNRPDGKRPHPHFNEGTDRFPPSFNQELHKQRLAAQTNPPWPGHKQPNPEGVSNREKRGDAVMWAYIDNPNWPYQSQNSKGKIMKPQRSGAVKDPAWDEGYKRIVADKNKTQLGYMYHPLGEKKEFVRAKVVKQQLPAPVNTW